MPPGKKSADLKPRFLLTIILLRAKKEKSKRIIFFIFINFFHALFEIFDEIFNFPYIHSFWILWRCANRTNSQRSLTRNCGYLNTHSMCWQSFISSVRNFLMENGVKFPFYYRLLKMKLLLISIFGKLSKILLKNFLVLFQFQKNNFNKFICSFY